MKEKKNKLLVVLIPTAIALVAVVVLLCLALFTPIFLSPKERVILAFAKTYGQNPILSMMYEDVTSVEPDDTTAQSLFNNTITQASENVKVFMEGCFESEYSLTFEEFTSDALTEEELATIDMMQGAGIYGVIQSDIPNRLLYNEYGVRYNGARLLNMELFVDDTTISVACEDFLDGYVSFESDTFGEDFVNSELCAMLVAEGSISEYDLALIENYSFNTIDAFSYDDTAVLDDEIKSEIVTIVKSYFDAIEVEKTGETSEIEIGDNDTKCQEYQIIISEDATEECLDALEDLLVPILTERYMAELNNNMGDDFFENSGMTESQFENELESLFEEYFSLIQQIFVNESEIYVYLDNKGNLIELSLNLEIDGKDSYGEEIDVDLAFDITYHGEEFLMDAVDGVLEVTEHGDTVEFVFSSTGETSGSTRTDNFECIVSADNEDAMRIAYDAQYNTDKSEFNATLTLKELDLEEEIILSLETTLDSSDSMVSLSFDKLRLETAGMSENFTLELSGTYSVAPLDGDVKNPSGEEYKIFEMTETELGSLLLDMTSTFMESPLYQMIETLDQ